MIIKVKDLVKEYSYHEKEAGIKGSLKNLVKRKKIIRKAVKGINFQISEGEMVGFIGSNGAGKTTTLKILSGILHPTSGEVQVLGYIPQQRKNDFKRQFSFISGQKNQLWWDLPANESFLLNKYIYGIDDDSFYQTVNELAVLLEVESYLKVQVRKLSFGERMKMELIAALLHQPKVLFLDEPTIGLDIITQNKIRMFLKEYNHRTKTTILLTSHYMSDIEQLCKRSIVINDGIIVYDGLLKDINDKLNKIKIVKITLTQKPDLELIKRFGTIKEIIDFAVVLEIKKDCMQEAIHKMLQFMDIQDINIQDVPIEESVQSLLI